MNTYRVHTYIDTFEIYELTETSTRSRVTICPERGGIVLSYQAFGRELLYLDKATFVDPDANIRGGIPVLFPISGQLPGGTYVWDGVSYSMRNHGVARNRPWRVVRTSDEEQASITLALASDAGTLESFPFDFELTFTYVLKDGKLQIQQEYRNHSERPMPMYAGFHPYFAASPGPISYQTDASRMLDYNDNQEKEFTGVLDMADKPESVVLLGAKDHQLSFSVDEGVQIGMSYSDHFPYVVLWGVRGKPFICVEPWMAMNDEMSRKQELTIVEPGACLTAELSIYLEP